MTRSNYRSAISRARGFTLIEVLVALFVLAVGLLGLALLQTTGLRLNTDSYSRTQATYAAYDIIDKMRANASTLSNYLIATTADANSKRTAYAACKTTTCNCATNECTPTQLATYDLGQWYDQQDRLVPGAKDAGDAGQRATISINANTVVVTMNWYEQENQGTSPALRQESWTVGIF